MPSLSASFWPVSLFALRTKRTRRPTASSLSSIVVGGGRFGLTIRELLAIAAIPSTDKNLLRGT